jgi:cholesterol transport system auxiliary component
MAAVARGARRGALTAAPLALALATGACISFGADPPDQLLTLTPAASTPAGSVSQGRADAALVVLEPSTSQALNVTRVPVRVDASSLAYLEDAIWVEKPTQLFRSLLAETIRAGGNRLVVGGGELEYAASTQLSGQLVEMGYDVASSSAVVRFDAVLALPGGEIRTRRFESAVSGVTADAAAVGPALNQAANTVAAEIAAWVG